MVIVSFTTRGAGPAATRKDIFRASPKLNIGLPRNKSDLLRLVACRPRAGEGPAGGGADSSASDDAEEGEESVDRSKQNSYCRHTVEYIRPIVCDMPSTDEKMALVPDGARKAYAGLDEGASR